MIQINKKSLYKIMYSFKKIVYLNILKSALKICYREHKTILLLFWFRHGQRKWHAELLDKLATKLMLLILYAR